MNSTWRKLVEASEERPLMLTLAQRNAIAEADAHMGRLEAQMALVNTDRALTARAHAAELATLHEKIYDLLRNQLLLISKGAADTERIAELERCLSEYRKNEKSE